MLSRVSIRRVLAIFALCAAIGATPVPTSAQDATHGWQSVDTGQTDNTYVGAIDVPADGSGVATSGTVNVSGWFVDTTAQGWAGADAMQVLQSGMVLADGVVGRDRPDVAGTLGNPFWSASGWSANVDAGRLPVGPVALSINLHTPGKGWWTHALNVVVGGGGGSGEILAPAPAAVGPLPNLAVSTPQPGEAVSTSNRRYVISGTAIDPSKPSGGVDWVELWLNGEANTEGASILGVADVNADGSWSLTFDPAQFQPTDVNLYAYAHSAVSGKRREVVVHFQITNRR
jgi:hypothetical protein